jgi:hypothetical protein
VDIGYYLKFRSAACRMRRSGEFIVAPGRDDSGLYKTVKFFVHPILEGGAHAMWRALVDLKLRILDDLGGEHRADPDRYDLVVVAMQDQRRNVEPLEVFVQVRFRERLDTEYEAGSRPSYSASRTIPARLRISSLQAGCCCRRAS